jgi:hypothetical protein
MAKKEVSDKAELRIFIEQMKDIVPQDTREKLWYIFCRMLE